MCLLKNYKNKINVGVYCFLLVNMNFLVKFLYVILQLKLKKLFLYANFIVVFFLSVYSKLGVNRILLVNKVRQATITKHKQKKINSSTHNLFNR